MSWFTNEKNGKLPEMAIQIVSISMHYSTQKRSSNIWLMLGHVFSALTIWKRFHLSIDLWRQYTIKKTWFVEPNSRKHLWKRRKELKRCAKRKKIAKLRSKWHVACSQKTFIVLSVPWCTYLCIFQLYEKFCYFTSPRDK